MKNIFVLGLLSACFLVKDADAKVSVKEYLDVIMDHAVPNWAVSSKAVLVPNQMGFWILSETGKGTS